MFHIILPQRCRLYELRRVLLAQVSEDSSTLGRSPSALPKTPRKVEDCMAALANGAACCLCPYGDDFEQVYADNGPTTARWLALKGNFPNEDSCTKLLSAAAPCPCSTCICSKPTPIVAGRRPLSLRRLARRSTWSPLPPRCGRSLSRIARRSFWRSSWLAIAARARSSTTCL